MLTWEWQKCLTFVKSVSVRGKGTNLTLDFSEEFSVSKWNGNLTKMLCVLLYSENYRVHIESTYWFTFERNLVEDSENGFCLASDTLHVCFLTMRGKKVWIRVYAQDTINKEWKKQHFAIPQGPESKVFLVELEAKFLVAFYMNLPMWIPWHQLIKLRSCLSVFLASSTKKYYPLFPLHYFLKIRRNLASLRPNVSIQIA